MVSGLAIQKAIVTRGNIVLIKFFLNWANITNVSAKRATVPICYIVSNMPRCYQEFKMLNPPRTPEEAQAYKYGIWTWDIARWPHQSLEGQPYFKGHCAYEVSYIRGSLHQCKHENGHGPNNLYCKQHAEILAREEKYSIKHLLPPT